MMISSLMVHLQHGFSSFEAQRISSETYVEHPFMMCGRSILYMNVTYHQDHSYTILDDLADDFIPRSSCFHLQETMASALYLNIIHVTFSLLSPFRSVNVFSPKL